MLSDRSALLHLTSLRIFLQIANKVRFKKSRPNTIVIKDSLAKKSKSNICFLSYEKRARDTDRLRFLSFFLLLWICIIQREIYSVKCQRWTTVMSMDFFFHTLDIFSYSYYVFFDQRYKQDLVTLFHINDVKCYFIFVRPEVLIMQRKRKFNIFRCFWKRNWFRDFRREIINVQLLRRLVNKNKRKNYFFNKVFNVEKLHKNYCTFASKMVKENFEHFSNMSLKKIQGNFLLQF